MLFLSALLEMNEGYVYSNMLPQILPIGISLSKAPNVVYLHFCIPKYSIRRSLGKNQVVTCSKYLNPTTVSVTRSSAIQKTMYFNVFLYKYYAGKIMLLSFSSFCPIIPSVMIMYKEKKSFIPASLLRYFSWLTLV